MKRSTTVVKEATAGLDKIAVFFDAERTSTNALLAELASRLAEHVKLLNDTAAGLRIYMGRGRELGAKDKRAINPMHAANRLDKAARELTKVKK